MSAAREGFDLFTKPGRTCFARNLRHGRWPTEMWADTFAQIWCFVVSHQRYDCNEGGTPDYACKRCHHFLR